MWSVFARGPSSPCCDKDACAPPPPSLPHQTPLPHWECWDLSGGSLSWPLYGSHELKNWYWTMMVITFCFYQFLIGRVWSEILTAKISEILSTPIFVTFLPGGLVQISRYSAGESLPIKAGQPAAAPHLVIAWGEDNIIEEENISEVWENHLLQTLPGQNSKEMLLRMCQHFVDAYIFSMPIVCRRLTFVNAYIWLTPIFCPRQYFVETYILSTPIFCWHLTFVNAYILSTPIFCWRLCFNDDYYWTYY